MAEVMFTSKATAEGGREGHVKSANGVVDHNLVMPKGGSPTTEGTNPEELFAAGYAACFDGALNLIASKAEKEIDSKITAEVSLIKDPSDDGFKLGVLLNAHVNGVSQEEAEDLVHKAHDFCPYSKATRNNIEVELNVVTG
ncbi:Organic hydroperoxide resistance protein OhrA [Alteribacter lacisalsi]|uniref:Organic hydroperoxide resistance protein OhrA n=1 Tax=Alteribacter lacisalsi TaxID=2045244 RepID=A0A2W0HMJ2_9BACI|nr:organic hydroperoxide resistance protein [Alteribacter lacisalsi]PYZ98292.1 Organic hydroperoxide resistance protein OhrA [Alteribacter lacisalsi]